MFNRRSILKGLVSIAMLGPLSLRKVGVESEEIVFPQGNTEDCSASFAAVYVKKEGLEVKPFESRSEMFCIGPGRDFESFETFHDWLERETNAGLKDCWFSGPSSD